MTRFGVASPLADDLLATSVQRVSIPRSLVRRAYDSPAAHRLVPWPVERRALKSWAARAWESDIDLRRDATLQMKWLLGRSTRADEIDELAPKYAEQRMLRKAAIWRPWRTTRPASCGISELQELVQSGRGVIVSFAHHGDFYGALGSLGFINIHIPTAPAVVTSTASHEERQIARTMAWRGGNVFSSTSSYERLRDILRQGRVIALSCDVAGNAHMTILGRDVQGSSGVAKLASETGAWIMPMNAYRHALGQLVALEAPIDPDSFPDWQTIHAEIARRYEPAILAWPEALHEPLRRWKPADRNDYDEFGYDPKRMASLRI